MPPEQDPLRDIGFAQALLDGNWFGDPSYPGSVRYYPPLLTVLAAVGALLSGMQGDLPGFWIAVGPWVNLGRAVVLLRYGAAIARRGRGGSRRLPRFRAVERRVQHALDGGRLFAMAFGARHRADPVLPVHPADPCPGRRRPFARCDADRRRYRADLPRARRACRGADRRCFGDGLRGAGSAAPHSCLARRRGRVRARRCDTVSAADGVAALRTGWSTPSRHGFGGAFPAVGPDALAYMLLLNMPGAVAAILWWRWPRHGGRAGPAHGGHPAELGGGLPRRARPVLCVRGGPRAGRRGAKRVLVLRPDDPPLPHLSASRRRLRDRPGRSAAAVGESREPQERPRR